MALLSEELQLRHLLRRAGFSMSRRSIDTFRLIRDTSGGGEAGYAAVVDALLSFNGIGQDADDTGLPGQAGGQGLNRHTTWARYRTYDSELPNLPSGTDAPASTMGDELPPDRLHPAKAPDQAPGAVTPQAFSNTVDLRRAWMLRMIYSARPALEKLTLYWHNHLTSNSSTVNSTGAMANQVDLFRRLGTGSFLTLLRGITRDPAMLVYLDNDSNRAFLVTNPDGSRTWEGSNENYARELLELYGLGIDSGYTEDDVKAAARALTGWGLNSARTRFLFRFNEHVTSRGATSTRPSGDVPWTFLGESQRWGQVTIGANSEHSEGFPWDPTASVNPAQDIHQKIVDWPGYDPDGAATPKAASFLAGKLWTYFGGPTAALSPVDRDAMVAAYRGQGPHTTGLYGIRGMLRAMYLSPSFRSDASYRALVKTPAEFIAGVHRVLQATGTFSVRSGTTLTSTIYGDTPEVSGPAEDRELGTHLRIMDQDLLNPPFPSGWGGGEAWLNSSTWLARVNYVNEVVSRRPSDFRHDPSIQVLATSQSSDQVSRELARAEGIFNARNWCIQNGIGSWEALVDHCLDTFIDVTPATAPGTAAGSYTWWRDRLLAYVGAVAWNAANPDWQGTTGSPTEGTQISPSLKLRGVVYLVLASPAFQLA